MSRRTIYIVIVLAVISLIGIVVTQIYWVNKAYNLQQKQFNDRVVIAMTSVVDQIMTINKDSAGVEPVQQVSNNYYVANINDTLHPYLLESLLKQSFASSNLKQDFEYGIYDCFTDSIVFGSKVNFDSPDNEVKPEDVSFKKRFDKDGHYFGVYFPGKSAFILSQLDFWVFSSVMILMVVIFFSYAIVIMLRQKRLSEVKTDFINNMTHELKTPISTISLSSEVLMKKDIVNDPDRLNQYARIIHSENNRLKTQVDKVLQIATLSPEKVNIKSEELDLHEILQSAVETFRVSLQDGQGKITTELNAQNSTILGDRVHITNIIYNLLDNAQKYTEQTPEIEVRTENENGFVKIAISDNGVGIDKNQQPLIFDKFYRVPKGNLHDVKGFGLGLFYVKTIVTAHKGKIRVESEPGKGSTFTVLLKNKQKSSD
ncbi:sensor histidine kinase [Halocola ammonii]